MYDSILSGIYQLRSSLADASDGYLCYNKNGFVCSSMGDMSIIDRFFTAQEVGGSRSFCDILAWDVRIVDWIKQLNHALDYIEDNLDGEISTLKISKIMGCSIYNFQRMFSYIENKPLSEYIRSRRLRAALFSKITRSGQVEK